MSGLCVAPGPKSMEGLAWLARVGAAPPETLRLVVGWTERLAFDHIRRLVDAGYVRRVAMTRGQGSLVVMTSAGAAMVGYPASRALRSVAPTTWAHATGCAWTSAWLVLRLRDLRAQAPQVDPRAMEWWGERDVAADDFWRREVRFKDHRGIGRVTHRPDLGLRLGGLPIPVEVELQRKSRARLRGILGMYDELVSESESPFAGVIYVTGTPDIAEGIRRAAQDVGLGEPGLTFRAYSDVIAQTRAAGGRRAADDQPDPGDVA